MTKNSEDTPDPKEIEKEIGEFLNKRFGGSIKIVSPGLMPQKSFAGKRIPQGPPKKKKINFDLKPAELVAYLDQYIVRQDKAKAVLATKICTHFNRIKHLEENPEDAEEIIGRIKSNILMAGPTGVGKTYMVKLIAKKLGVPFVKGDATKFSETGYVGGDVEDLIRDLVREAEDDIDMAQCGIVYIDEIDKIAGSTGFRGADISRTGVQRALLKPMEDTDVELKVPHDPVSVMQELSRFQETGSKEKRVVNTANILFIVSGAFSDISPIIKKRLHKGAIGFGSDIASEKENAHLLKHLSTEDLVAYGFESEFIGRLPVRTVFELLTEEDLFQILKQPNSPIVLGKKLDFAAYGIDMKFQNDALTLLAQRAFSENTGARGLVSAVEQALLPFENLLPSSGVSKFPVTRQTIETPDAALEDLMAHPEGCLETFDGISREERTYIQAYIESSWKHLSLKHGLTLSPDRSRLVAAYCGSHITGIDRAIRKVKEHYEDVKTIELTFLKNHDLNILFEEDAMDFIIEQLIETPVTIDEVFTRINTDFEPGLKLVQKKRGFKRFFITKEALNNPEKFITELLKKKLTIENHDKIE